MTLLILVSSLAVLLMLLGVILYMFLMNRHLQPPCSRCGAQPRFRRSRAADCEKCGARQSVPASKSLFQ